MRGWAGFVSGWLSASKARLWGALCLLTALAAWGASRLKVSEDIADFFPRADARGMGILSRLKTMERLTFVFESRSNPLGDEATMDTDERLIDAAERMAARLERQLGDRGAVKLYFGAEQMDSMASFVYRHLPVLLDDSAYASLDTILTPDGVRRRLQAARNVLLSPAGGALAPCIDRDPLMIGLPLLGRLRDAGAASRLEMNDGYLFSADGRRLLMFVDVGDDFLDAADGAGLGEAVRGAIERTRIEDGVRDVEVYVHGAPLVTEANTARVKADEALTLTVALAVLTAVLLLVFRSPRSVLLLLAPVAFGALFAMGVIAAMGIELSRIALGAGSTILGLGLSYSIHIVTHATRAASARQIVDEMAWPMTVGSVTTVGAFSSMLFANSTVLRHIGLFASLTLAGTLLFCLVFLPHLLGKGRRGGRALRLVERIAGYDYSRNRWLVGGLAATFCVALFFFTDVRFNADLSTLNYTGDSRLQESLRVVEQTLGIDGHQSAVVVTGDDAATLAARARGFAALADSLVGKGLRSYSSTAASFMPTSDEATARAARWRATFTPGRVAATRQALLDAGAELGFAPGTFAPFLAAMERDPDGRCIGRDELLHSPLFGEWVSEIDGLLAMTFRVETDSESRDAVFAALGASPHTVVADMGYYSRRATLSIVDDFNWLLTLSSFIVAAALLASYGRVELFLLTFAPMCVGWVIILGLMALFGVEFNVVNVILSTFIFGVGDDYAIFIMDGLQADYSRGRRVMSGHKTAIVLSTFAAMAGLGSQVFGRHPAIHSLGLISIFGLAAVIVTSFVVQPLLFRLLVLRPSGRGGLPYTLASLCRGSAAFVAFGATCVVGQAAAAALSPLPAARRRGAMRQLVFRMMRAYLWACRPLLRIETPTAIGGGPPAVVACNHQSLLDVLTLLSATPRLVFMVKGWVASSPLLGPMTRALGYCLVDGGLDEAGLRALRVAADEGCSIVVFPEGGRSFDCRIRRYHKGAAALASLLGLPLRPVVIRGNGMAVPKRQPLNLMRCRVSVQVLGDIAVPPDADEAAVGAVTRQLQSTAAATLARMEAAARDDTYWRDLLLRGYLYRGGAEYAAARRFARRAPTEGLPAPDAEGRVDVGASPLGLEAFWVAIMTGARVVACTVADADEAEFCRRSPLAGYLAARGKRVEFNVATA